MARIRVEAYIPLVNYKEEVDHFFLGQEDYIVAPSNYGWKDKYICTTNIRDLEQYDADKVLITYWGFIQPILVRGLIDDINDLIIDAEFQEHALLTSIPEVVQEEEETHEEE